MHNERRSFLKSTLAATAVGVGTLVAARRSVADPGTPGGGNGVVVGHSPKKEILYKKSAAWDLYYKAAY